MGEVNFLIALADSYQFDLSVSWVTYVQLLHKYVIYFTKNKHPYVKSVSEINTLFSHPIWEVTPDIGIRYLDTHVAKSSSVDIYI
jgi:hypothetical protein